MTVRSFPFEGQDEAPEDDYYRLHRESGVLSGLNLTLAGLNWSLSPGEMFVGGAMLLVESTPATGLSQATTGSNPRRDMLVARRTLAVEGRSSAVLVLRQGTPAAIPVAPEPVRQRIGVWEEPLFSWRVPAGGATTVSEVRDLRVSGYEEPRKIPNMAARPTVDRYLGLRVKPLDRPTVVYAWDGTRWVQEGVLSGDVNSAPANSYVSQQVFSYAARIENAGGGFQVPLQFPYSAPPLWADLAQGDSTEGGALLFAPIPSQHTTNAVSAAASAPGGQRLQVPALVRTTCTALGYNT